MTRSVRVFAPCHTRVSSLASDAGAVIIGKVKPGPAGQVTQRSVIGAERIVDRLSGE